MQITSLTQVQNVKFTRNYQTEKTEQKLPEQKANGEQLLAMGAKAMALNNAAKISFGSLRVISDDEPERRYYDNGQVELEKYPDGTLKRYYPSGQLLRETLRNGDTKRYYENGQISEERLSNGDVKYWDKKGNLTSLGATIILSDNVGSMRVGIDFEPDGKIRRISCAEGLLALKYRDEDDLRQCAESCGRLAREILETLNIETSQKII